MVALRAHVESEGAPAMHGGDLPDPGHLFADLRDRLTRATQQAASEQVRATDLERKLVALERKLVAVEGATAAESRALYAAQVELATLRQGATSALSAGPAAQGPSR